MTNQILNVAKIQNSYDKGGEFTLAMKNKKFVYNNQNYTYLASGYMRDVFISDCGKWVIKLPTFKSQFFEYWIPTDLKNLTPPLMHNLHEYHCYLEAPQIYKKHIAKCELLPNGALLQEFVKVRQIGGYYREIGYRENGYRENGDCVVFDCDCFLENFEKPVNGYKYFETFENLAHYFPKEIAEFVKIEKYNKTYFKYVTECGANVRYVIQQKLLIIFKDGKKIFEMWEINLEDVETVVNEFLKSL